ncbi:hypothetical protein PLICRDRAFT_348688 [Plicaturopsis crispa FD-325 SS-3]|uniref:Uncharacterized protein n=1 Tax=Plicaturopsis crispa FD-325 SS-3 TaxID=944288 RepID=A0A0C9SRR0_PLICR|nr:hypothetical protein PLICRDRAFT_348688 [Plicaturopsis crispa FD-325 SS-3]
MQALTSVRSHTVLTTPFQRPTTRGAIKSTQIQRPYQLFPDTIHLQINDSPNEQIEYVYGEVLHRAGSCYRRRVTVAISTQNSLRFPRNFEHGIVIPMVEVFHQLRSPQLPLLVYTKTLILNGTRLFPSSADRTSKLIVSYRKRCQVLIQWRGTAEAAHSCLPALVFDVRQWSAGIVKASSMDPTMHSLLADIRSHLIEDPHIIISDATSVVAFSPIKVDNSTFLDLRFECATLTSDMSLRAVCAGFVYHCLDVDYLDLDHHNSRFVSHGALNHPNHIPLEADETVFATKRRCSDFDRYTLTHSPEHALQFFRWKSYIAANVSPHHATIFCRFPAQRVRFSTKLGDRSTRTCTTLC